MAFCVKQGIIADSTTQRVLFKLKVSDRSLGQHLLHEDLKMLDTIEDTNSSTYTGIYTSGDLKISGWCGSYGLSFFDIRAESSFRSCHVNDNYCCGVFNT